MSKHIDIKALRDRLGWTQEQMAEYLGLDRSSISRMEGGQAPKGPTHKLLSALSSKDSPSARNRRERAA